MNPNKVMSVMLATLAGGLGVWRCAGHQPRIGSENAGRPSLRASLHDLGEKLQSGGRDDRAVEVSVRDGSEEAVHAGGACSR